MELSRLETRLGFLEAPDLRSGPFCHHREKGEVKLWDAGSRIMTSVHTVCVWSASLMSPPPPKMPSEPSSFLICSFTELCHT